MKPRTFTRRDFLRVSAFTAAGAAAAACERAMPDGGATLTQAPTSAPTGAPSATPTQAPPSPPSPTPAALAELEISGMDSDVWIWRKAVSVKVTGSQACLQVVLQANGLDVETSAEGDLFRAEVPLSEGTNRVVAVCRRPDGGEVRSNMLNYQERLRQVPTAIITGAVDQGRIILDGGNSLAAGENGPGLAPALIDFIWSPRPGNPAPLTLQGLGQMEDREFAGEVSGQTITLLPPAVDGEYYLRLLVKDQAGREDSSTIYFEVAAGQARLPDFDRENPAWVETAIVYGVIPFMFGSPGFKAITGRLDYLAELGVNALWLAPVNRSPAHDYGYAIVDYFELNPAYGTKEEFHRMVQEAHARGIRVLMDFVPNHSSVEHPYFQDTLKNGKDSPYWDFYDRDENGQPTHYFDWAHLPNLNYNNPEVERWMLEAFSYWVREFDVDGFRVDVAWGVKERKPDFWPKWRRELKRIKPDLLLLAEASARDPYYFDNGFDAAYDWTDQLGRWAWELVFDAYKYRLLAYNLGAMLTNRPNGYHPDALVFRFLNNNDTGNRFITQHGEGVTRVATAMLLTLPGIPCIYTGDEVGAEFHPYQSSGPIAWVENFPGLREYHQKLIDLRKRLPSLHSRQWQRVEIAAIPQNVFGYIRYVEPEASGALEASSAPSEQPVLVLLNFSEEPAEIELDLPEAFSSIAGRGALYDLLAGETVPISELDRMQVSVPGLTARILTAGQAG